MQIRVLDGTMHQVAPTQVQKAYKMLPNAAKDLHKMQQHEGMSLHTFIQVMKKHACQYKEKASHNLQRLGMTKTFPCTEDDVKQLLIYVMKSNQPWRISEAFYEAVEFQAARFLKHLLSKFQEY